MSFVQVCLSKHYTNYRQISTKLVVIDQHEISPAKLTSVLAGILLWSYVTFNAGLLSS
jgi:hypothetical protein